MSLAIFCLTIVSSLTLPRNIRPSRATPDPPRDRRWLLCAVAVFRRDLIQSGNWFELFLACPHPDRRQWVRERVASGLETLIAYRLEPVTRGRQTMICVSLTNIQILTVVPSRRAGLDRHQADWCRERPAADLRFGRRTTARRRRVLMRSLCQQLSDMRWVSQAATSFCLRRHSKQRQPH